MDSQDDSMAAKQRWADRWDIWEGRRASWPSQGLKRAYRGAVWRLEARSEAVEG